MTDTSQRQKLSDHDVSYLKLLHTLKNSGTGNESEMGVVRRIAAWITSRTVLMAICRVSRWYDDWGVKEALVRNDYTPETVKPHLETKVAIFDLLGELDHSELTAEEKAEIRDSIRELTATLPEHDRGVVKNRAYELSSSRRGVQAPPKAADVATKATEVETPSPTADTPAPAKPAPVDVSPEDLDLLIDFDESDLQDELSDAKPSDAEPSDAEPSTTEVDTAATDHLAPTESPAAATDHLAPTESPVAEPPPAAPADAPGEQIVTAKEPAPQPADVDLDDLGFLDSLLDEKLARQELGLTNEETGGSIRLRTEELELDSDPDDTAVAEEKTRDDTAIADEPVEADTAVNETADDDTAVADAPSVDTPGVDTPGVDTPGADAQQSPAAPKADKWTLAATSTDRNVLATLIHEAEPIQMALLQNPAMNDVLAANLTRRAGAQVLKQIHRNRRMFTRPLVQTAFTENPNASSAALLEVVNGMGNLKALVQLLHNPKVKFLEVKSKARSRLTQVFKSMTTGEKLSAIRQSGRSLLKQLWREFFRDEPLVLACLREKQLDQGIVLEISRSSIAPRKALEQIGNTAAWANNKQICLALVQNPKTPRSLIPRLVRKLSPAERNQIKRNPSIPSHIRRAI